jgi:hypothetical protein
MFKSATVCGRDRRDVHCSREIEVLFGNKYATFRPCVYVVLRGLDLMAK